LFNFLWDGKPDKIARNVLYSKKELGGVAMCNIYTKNKALKLTWVKRLLDSNNSAWKFIMRQYIPMDLADFFQINISAHDAHLLFDRIRYRFVKEIFLYWCQYAFNVEPKESEISSQLLWLNYFIKIDINNVVFYKSWYTKGVKKVADLYHHNVILTHAEFQTRYGIRTNYIIYFGFLQTIPHTWKIFMNNRLLDTIPYVPKLDTFIATQTVCKFMDRELLISIARPPNKTYTKWTADFDFTNDEYYCYFQRLYNLTNCTQLQYFQFKILHRITATINYILK